MNKKTFAEVIKHLKELIHDTQFEGKTYIVGGAVRDLYLNKDIKDIDIVVELADGGILLGEFLKDKTKSPHTIIKYPTYGTCKFALDIPNVGKVDFEAVQTRKEWYTEGSRKPSAIAVGTIEDDAMRRDLTINALYYNITTSKIEDPTNQGKDDLLLECLRTPSIDPSETFKDDPLRMLRVVRFATKLCWGIEKETYRAIIENASKITSVSQERITDELSKILTSDVPSFGLEKLSQTMLLKHIMPSVQLLKKVRFNDKTHGDDTVYEHTLLVIDKTQPILEHRLAALLHDIGKAYNHQTYQANYSINPSETFLRKFKFSNKTIDKVIFAIENQNIFAYNENDLKNISDFKLRSTAFKLGANMDIVLDLINAENNSLTAGSGKENQVDIFKSKIQELKDKGENFDKINLPINGEDIMELLEMKSGGPIINRLLKFVEYEFFRNPNLTRDEALQVVKEKRYIALNDY